MDILFRSARVVIPLLTWYQIYHDFSLFFYKYIVIIRLILLYKTILYIRIDTTCYLALYHVIVFMFKRILLLIWVNIGILISLNILVVVIEKIFGVSISPAIGNQQWLIIFSLVFGFGGALVNLLISKSTARHIYNLQTLESNETDFRLRIVYDTVRDISFSHHITMPEVTYYESPEVNAFATGASKNNSLVAVSTGLLSSMSEKEIQAVIWHEMAHVLNGDMVTSTLLQWSLNTFVILFARILGGIIDTALSRDGESRGGFWYYIIVNILNTLFGFVAWLIIMRYSRVREYKADEGSARMLSKDNMIAALRKLAHIHDNPIPQDGYATMKIFGGASSFSELRMSHPPIEKRIQALEYLSL